MWELYLLNFSVNLKLFSKVKSIKRKKSLPNKACKCIFCKILSLYHYICTFLRRFILYLNQKIKKNNVYCRFPDNFYQVDKVLYFTKNFCYKKVSAKFYYL